jgi:hypothetical protein
MTGIPDHPASLRAPSAACLAATFLIGLSGLSADPTGQDPEQASTTQAAVPFTILPAGSAAVPLIKTAGGPAAGSEPASLLSAAQDPAEEAQRERRTLVAAATQSAVDRLMRRIEARTLTPDLTVGQFVGRLPAGSATELRNFLAAASAQVGGPRFPMPGVAEIQLQLRGEDVADELLRLATAAGSESPIPVDELERRLRTWNGVVFHATGGGAVPSVGAELRPSADRMPRSWQGISEEGRLKTLQEAQANAINKIIAQVEKLEVISDVPDPDAAGDQSTGKKPPLERNPLTLAKVFESAAGAETRLWLSEQPYSTVVYGEDRKVEVKLAVEPAEWAEQLRASMTRPDLGLPPIPEEEWERFRQSFMSRLNGSEVAGLVGEAQAPEPVQPGPPPLQLPPRPPEWTRLPLTAEASVNFGAGADARKAADRLRTQNEARDMARANLREQLSDLRISDTQTLGQIAQIHPGVANILDTAAAEAPVTNARRVDGGVVVQVALNPGALWQSIIRQAGTGPARGQAAPPPLAD